MSRLEVLGHLHRQRLDADLADLLREDAALLGAGRLAEKMHRNRDGDRLVEAHLLEVDVEDAAADWMLLEVLEHRRLRGGLVADMDVEDRVHPAGPVQRAAQLPLLDGDRVRRRAAVQDARDQALGPHPAGRPVTARLARAHFQFDSLTGHGGGL